MLQAKYQIFLKMSFQLEIGKYISIVEVGIFFGDNLKIKFDR